MLKELKIFRTFLPIAGSLGYLYYLNSNGNVTFNFSIESDSTKSVKKIFNLNISMQSDDTLLNKKIIQEVQNKAASIVFSNKSVLNKYGSFLSINQLAKSSLAMQRDLLDNDIHNTKAVLNLTRKNEFEILAEILVNIDIIRSRLYYIFPRIDYDIVSIDIKAKDNSKSKPIRVYDRFKLKSDDTDIDRNYERTVKVHPIQESERSLSKSQLVVIRDFTEDETKLNKFGRPIKFKIIKLLNPKNEEIEVDGSKSSAQLEIVNDGTKIKQIHAHYNIEQELKKLSFQTSSVATELLSLAKFDPCLQRIFIDINLSKMIEEKLIKKREFEAIGKPFKLSIDPEKQSIGKTMSKVKILLNGKLNKGELVLDLTRKSPDENWSILKSDLKILWNISE